MCAQTSQNEEFDAKSFMGFGQLGAFSGLWIEK